MPVTRWGIQVARHLHSLEIIQASVVNQIVPMRCQIVRGLLLHAHVMNAVLGTCYIRHVHVR